MSKRHLSTDDLSSLHKKHGRCGLCFPFALGLAGEAMNDGVYPEILVVHAELPLSGEHAWVERGGMAYDWQTRHRIYCVIFKRLKGIEPSFRPAPKDAHYSSYAK